MDKIKLIKNVSDKNRMLVLILMFLFLFGEFLGTFIFSVAEFKGIDSLIELLFYNRLECTFLQTVINSFSYIFILLSVCLLLGLSAFIQPIEFLIPIFYGFGVGILISELCCNYGVNGIIYSVILVIPYSVTSSYIVIIALRESIRMSNALSSNIIRCTEYIKVDLNLYIIKYIILLCILAVLSILNALATYLGAELWTELLGI